MFRARTVLVLGAGASVEVGLPTGLDLLTHIVKLTNISFEHYRQISGDHDILQALKIRLDEGSKVEKLNAHLAAGWQLGKSAKQALSIDNVIDALENPEVELIGKLGITKAILSAEAKSPQFQPVQGTVNDLEMTRFEGTWYSSLTKLLTENVRVRSIADLFKNIEIINFNYDRCLEHYLPFSLGYYYGITPDIIRQIMQSLVIHRPYGIVGRLPWQMGSTPSVGFGEGSPHQLAAVVQQIRTFTERVEEGDGLAAMKASISKADRIIFLGFAFHRQNVELLATKIPDHTEILATAFGISHYDGQVIQDELAKAFELEKWHRNNGRISLMDVTSDKLFKQNWRQITSDRSYS